MSFESYIADAHAALSALVSMFAPSASALRPIAASIAGRGMASAIAWPATASDVWSAASALPAFAVSTQIPTR